MHQFTTFKFQKLLNLKQKKNDHQTYFQSAVGKMIPVLIFETINPRVRKQRVKHTLRETTKKSEFIKKNNLVLINTKHV